MPATLSRLIHAVALVSLTACASLSALKSETSIDAGQSFLLGGGQPQRVQAAVKNVGRVPVTLLVQQDSTRRTVATLQPDESVEIELQPREMAIFANASTRRAAVKIDARASNIGGLGMRYEATPRN
jgi:hypothetical protein